VAKALKNEPPTSSVGRLLDKDAAARALHPSFKSSRAPLYAGDRPSTVPVRKTESTVLKREVVLTSEAEETLSQLVQTYRQATRTRLSNSHVIRALLRGVAHGMSEIQREAELLGTLKLPSNAKGCEHERERFEDALASSFVSAMRSLPSYRGR
jgi:hypothetical protein